MSLSPTFRATAYTSEGDLHVECNRFQSRANPRSQSPGDLMDFSQETVCETTWLAC